MTAPNPYDCFRHFQLWQATDDPEDPWLMAVMRHHNTRDRLGGWFFKRSAVRGGLTVITYLQRVSKPWKLQHGLSQPKLIEPTVLVEPHGTAWILTYEDTEQAII
jgi:hypothetical protein